VVAHQVQRDVEVRIGRGNVQRGLDLVAEPLEKADHLQQRVAFRHLRRLRLRCTGRGVLHPGRTRRYGPCLGSVALKVLHQHVAPAAVCGNIRFGLS